MDAADKLSCRPDFAVIVYPGYLALADKNFAANADIVAYILKANKLPAGKNELPSDAEALKRIQFEAAKE